MVQKNTLELEVMDSFWPVRKIVKHSQHKVGRWVLRDWVHGQGSTAGFEGYF